MSVGIAPVSRVGRLLLAGVALLLTSLIYRGQYHASVHDGEATSRTSGRQTKFAIIVMTTSETSYDWLSFSNKHKYAIKHGYDLIWDFEESREYLKVWDKLNLTASAISSNKAYEWIWILDFDTLITNTSTQISDVIERSLTFAEAEAKSGRDIDLILTRDCDPLNLGSMFLRASPWTLEFIEYWRAGAGVLDGQGKLRNEQDVLRDMLHDNAFNVAERSVIAPQWMFDAYPEEIECYDPRDPRPWEPGMFLLHFAGARWRLKGQKDPIGGLMRKYRSQIV